MKHLLLTTLAMLLLLAAACSDSKEFRVEGNVRGLGTRNVTLQYIAEGVVRTASTTAIDGKFMFTGSSRDYALAEIYSGGTSLGCFVVRNGETLKCQLDMDNPNDMSITGNKPSEQLSNFLAEHAQILADLNTQALNSAIEAYVLAHRDRLSSALLLITRYDSSANPSRADSLMTLIAPEARPITLTSDFRLQVANAAEAVATAKVKSFILSSDGDSLENYMPTRYTSTLLYFRGNTPGERRDTVLPILKKLRKDFTPRDLHITEIGMVEDSTQWAGMTSASDSITWTRVFAPGGRSFSPFDGLNLPRLPYFVVSSENGTQLYRGQSATEAAETVARLLDSKKSK